MSAKTKQDNNVTYTVLMGIALVAMTLSCLLLHYDIARYPTMVP